MFRQLTRQWQWHWGTQVNTLAQVEIDARSNTQENLEAYVVVHRLADKLAEVKVLTLNETLARKELRLVPTLAYKQVEVKS